MPWPSFGDLKAALSLSFSHKLTISAASLALMACPQWLRDYLNADEFLKIFGWIILLTFVISTASCATESVSILFKKLESKKRLDSNTRHTIAKLKALDYSEKSVLREFFRGRKTINLPVDQSTVRGLLSDQILLVVGRAAIASREGRLVACRISDVTIEYLESIPLSEFIGIAGYEHVSIDNDGKIKPDAGYSEWLEANAPDFVRSLDRSNYYNDWR